MILCIMFFFAGAMNESHGRSEFAGVLYVASAISYAGWKIGSAKKEGA